MTRYLKPLLVLAASVCLLGVLFALLAGQTGSPPPLGDTVVLPASDQEPSGSQRPEPQSETRGPDRIPPELDEVDDTEDPGADDSPGDDDAPGDDPADDSAGDSDDAGGADG